MKSNLAMSVGFYRIADALADAVEQLEAAGVDSAHIDARLLMCHLLGVNRSYLTLYSHEELDEETLAAYDDLVARRASREPMAQILGEREFWGLNFRVTQDTLDPRPDSETIVDAVLRYVPTRHTRLMIADFGVGTGCLLLSLLHEYPHAHGLGVDVSEAALEVARYNARMLDLANRATFHNTSWGEGVVGKYDVIISNPPYITEAEMLELQPEVAKFEPRSALVGGEDGLECYRALMPHVKRLLAANGVAVMEVGFGQADDVTAIGEAEGLQLLEISCDLSGVERCVVFAHASERVSD